MCAQKNSACRHVGCVLICVGAMWSAAAQPAPPVRTIAEWEPAVGTLIRWPLYLSTAAVIELAQDDLLFVLVNTPADEAQARAALASWGVSLAHVRFIQSSAETPWTCDWGPRQVFDGTGTWVLVDPLFAGYPYSEAPCAAVVSPGGSAGDDAVNADLADYFGAPRYALPAYLTGSNFLVDGHSSAFSTCALVQENLQLGPEQQFYDQAQLSAGIQTYRVLDNVESNGLQHIDSWLKVLDDETLLVKRVPAWHAEYARIEANVQALQGLTDVYGRPYRVLRIDCPPYAPTPAAPPYYGTRLANYTSALILNQKVLVPLFDNPAADARALETWSAAMPGYQIVGLTWDLWDWQDALHSRAQPIFDRHMLRIAHGRLEGSVLGQPGFPVTATIEAHSGAGLIEDQLRVQWRVEGASDWNWVPLTRVRTTDTYTGEIPSQAVGVVIQYYIAAADNSGRSEALPRTAPGGFYQFTVADPGLTIRVASPPTILPVWTSVPFDVTIEPGNETLVEGTALLRYGYHGTFLATPLEPLGGNLYRATLPRAVCGDTPRFYVSAEGSSTGLKTYPPGAPDSFFPAVIGQLSPQILAAETFETGLPSGWSATGLWHVTSACAELPPCGGPPWAYYGQDGTCNYDTGAQTTGALVSSVVVLPAPPPGGHVTLRYCSALRTERQDGYDVARVLVNGELADVPLDQTTWEERTVDLTPRAGQSITLTWFFDSVDEMLNRFHGWQVDDIEIVADVLSCEFELPYPRGDLDCNGRVDFDDINPFIEALAGEDVYVAEHPDCVWMNADANGDGLVQFDDIDAFVDLLVDVD